MPEINDVSTVLSFIQSDIKELKEKIAGIETALRGNGKEGINERLKVVEIYVRDHLDEHKDLRIGERLKLLEESFLEHERKQREIDRERRQFYTSLVILVITTIANLALNVLSNILK